MLFALCQIWTRRYFRINKKEDLGPLFYALVFAEIYLDAIATEQIKMSLDEIKKDRTLIIISHSISQIIDAANIIVMEMGTVAETGTHETLYDSKGVYYDIFTAMANSLNIDKIKLSMED
jgi:ABC-type multidrug transport system ATPase subunit